MAAAAPPPARQFSRHRKRFSVSRLSSDTTATLPEYESTYRNSLLPTPDLDGLDTEDQLEQPPDYPDSADEADEETDDLDALPPLSPPPTSPRRRKFYRSVSSPRAVKLYANPVTRSDTFLDSLLERSVNALELSNALLQSSMSTQTSLSTVLGSDSNSSDRVLDTRARVLTDRIRSNEGMQERWMDNLDVLARDVVAFCGDDVPDQHDAEGIGVAVPRVGKPIAREASASSQVSRSLPSSGFAMLPRRRASLDSHSRGNHARSNSSLDGGRLQLDTPEKLALQSPPPRALTQYVTAGVEEGIVDASEATSDMGSIYLSGTMGHRSSVSDFRFPARTTTPALSSTISSVPPSPAYTSLARHVHGHSPSSSLTSRSSQQRIGRSPTPTYRNHNHSRSRSRSISSSQNHQPPSQNLPRLIPPPITPIEELPSQSDSSNSDTSPHPFRTMESLQKILDKQPMSPSSTASAESKGKKPDVRTPPAFAPRTPPVAPVTGTSSTTTSISRLFTRGAHSTSTRARSPPKHSSLKQRPPDLSTSNLSIPDLGSPGPGSASGSATHSRSTSGRSTPRNVAFGPLPESYAGSKPAGATSRFQEQKSASRRSKRKGGDRDHDKAGDKSEREREKDREESSWWTTWLTGGSVLSMSAARQEEKAEDRMARSWGRPGMGAGFDDWPV